MVASPEHRFSQMEAVPPSELSAEPLVHYNPDNGFPVWVDQFAAQRGVVLPQPVLRTGSPRTAAQLAAAGLGVAIVPFSALTPQLGATVRSFGPAELREVVAVVAAEAADKALATIRAHPLGEQAAIIGHVTAKPPGLVQMKTGFGGTRIVDLLVGDPLPRIC